MRNSSDRTPMQTVSNASNSSSRLKRLGGYLMEAGLITPSQLEVALNDQQATGMRFGEILVARGWVKEQTIEYLMKKVVLPERQAATRDQTSPRSQTTLVQNTTQVQANQREESPVTPRSSGIANKPERKLAWGELPIYNPKSSPVASCPGEDIDWVG